MLRNLAWSEYARLDKKGYNADPEQILVTAVKKHEYEKIPNVAVDLGAGKGRDTRFLLEKGFHVIAVENDKESVETLKELECDHLNVLECSIDNIDLEDLPKQLSLINASYSLPYIGKAAVTKTLPKLLDRVVFGGIFCGQFFGPRCSFVVADPTGVASHTKDEIVELFSANKMVVEACDPEKGVGARMDIKSCEKDFIHVLAKKKG